MEKTWRGGGVVICVYRLVTLNFINIWKYICHLSTIVIKKIVIFSKPVNSNFEKYCVHLHLSAQAVMRKL